MSQFAHFLRFFGLADDQRDLPASALSPAGTYPTLRICPGDRLRWLVPKSDVGGLALYRTELVLINAKTGALVGAVGHLRRQACENYVQFRLTIDGLPADGQQFALMRGEQAVPVLGTMTGSFPTLDAYITAIQAMLEGYPHAPVITFRQGSDLIVRVFRSARFDPSDADLRSWYVGIGQLDQSSYNTNSPSLSAQRIGTLTLGATDAYTVVVAPDIEAGNVFSFQGVTYTATQTDTPETVLAALGITSPVQLPSGTSISLSALSGVYRNENRNAPALQLLYNSSAVGTDRYLVVIGADVQAGNVYQVSASGMTTKTVVATEADTPATIAAQFNTSSGFLAVPAGQNPVGLTSPGATTLANTNTPAIYLTGKVSTPARTVDRYRVYVGSSIRRGNTFVIRQQGLPDRVVTARSSDQSVDIAVALGYTTNPFQVDVPASEGFACFAGRGVRLAEPEDVAPVRLSEPPVQMRPEQYVAEITMPVNGQGLFSLGLLNRYTCQVVALSNRLDVHPAHRHYTSVLRWGSLPGMAQVFGFHYGEDGLTQQLRLPVLVNNPRQKSEETQYKTQSGIDIRTDLRVSYQRTLTTDMLPHSFHRALLLALKHPRVLIDGQPVRCLSDYRETDPTPFKQEYQAQTDLTEVDMTHYRPARYEELDNRPTARVVGLLGTDVLAGLWLHGEGALMSLQAGMSVLPGEYDLRAFCPQEPYALAAYVNDQRVLRSLLTVDRLNRAGRLRLEPGDRLLLMAVPRDNVPGGELESAGFPETADLTTLAETLRRGPDFTPDFNSDFTY